MLSPAQRSALLLALLVPLVGFEQLSTPAKAAPLTTPLRVPLQWAPDPDNPSILKLGIQASLNGGSARLFEFDTGGTGFFATFATNFASSSPWWGSNTACPSGSCTPFTTTYDSGLTYTGNIVTSSVSLFGSSATPLLTVPNLSVGQTTAITCNPGATCSSKSGQSSDSGWNATTGLLNPPVQGNFYGDFGLSLRNGGSGGPNSPITQGAFWAAFDPSITRGYRVHAASDNPWVQFGLTAADLAPRPLRFALNGTGGTSTGSLEVSQGSTTFSGADLTTLIFDTGATTTIHTGAITINGDPFPPSNFPCGLTTQGCVEPTAVSPGSQVQISGLSLSTGKPTTILDFMAGNNKATSPAFNEVAVQGYMSTTLAPACAALAPPQPCYYVNTGILPFLSNDVIVDLSTWSAANPSGELSLVEQVPAPPALLAPFAVLGAARRLRKRQVGGQRLV
ncbi:MAG: hypothetical protein RLZZ609_721 [Cyanobacteriota bacterium]|jgi:hypothetical protein